MLLNFLGRGSAFNVTEGNNSAYVKVNDEFILIDCGESIFEKIVKKNLMDDVKKVNVLITHIHSDHVGSLSSFIYYCYYIKNMVVNVYFPDNIFVEFMKIQGNIDGVDYRFKLLEIGKNNEIGSITVKPVPVEHVKNSGCYGYLIYLEGKLIWYSGDCSKVSHVINEYDIDEFYQDTCLADYEGNAHTCFRVLCQSIPKDKRHKVYCMHLDDCDKLIKKVKEEGFNVVELK